MAPMLPSSSDHTKKDLTLIWTLFDESNTFGKVYENYMNLIQHSVTCCGGFIFASQSWQKISTSIYGYLFIVMKTL